MATVSLFPFRWKGITSAGFAFALTASALAGAEEKSAWGELLEDARLEEMIAYAMENNPDLEAAFERWRADLEQAPQARSLPDPNFNYGVFVARSSERLGMMQRQRFSIAQTFPWFGTLNAREGRAQAQAHAAAYRLEAEINRATSAIRRQYAEYYYVESARQILEEQAELVEGLRDAVEAGYEAGFAGRADVLRVEIELDQTIDAARSFDQQLEPVKSELNALLGRSADIPLPPPVAWEFSELSDAELRELAERIYDHPELRARDREIKGLDEVIRLARYQARPDFTVGVEAVERRGESSEGMLMFGMTLPIWRENYAAARREADARKRATQAGREAFSLDLEARLAEAVFQLRDAERSIRLIDDSLLPMTEDTLAILEAAYAEGEASFADTVDAQRKLLNLRLSRARALADQAAHFAVLQELAPGESTRR